MRTFSRSSFNHTNSPSLDQSTNRFTRLKQNLDIYNIRASNYKSALERTFERASQIDDYNYCGGIFQDFSSPSLAYSSKPTTSTPSFFSSNPSYSTHSKRPPVRYNSNSAISPYNKKSTTPSSLFNKKWNSKIDNYSYQSYGFNNYDENDEDYFEYKSYHNTSNTFSSIENNLPNKSKEKKNTSKDDKIIYTPNRVQNKKKSYQENQNTTFDLDFSSQSKNDTYDLPDQKLFNEEEEEAKIKIDQIDELIIEEEEEEVDEKKSTNSNSKISKENHSQAYLNAMSAVNAKMQKFNSELNKNSKKKQKSKNEKENDNKSNKKEIENDSNKKEKVEVTSNDPIQNEEEDEFKKKQRVEIEEIKSLYAILEQELKKIQKESNSANSNSGNDLNVDEENDESNLNHSNDDLNDNDDGEDASN